MSTRSPRALLCFLVSMSVAQAAEFNWSARGCIDLETPSNWKVRGTTTEEGGYTFLAHPESGSNALLQISVMTIPRTLVLSDADLRLRLHDSLRTYIDQSVEKEFRVQDLACRQGRGWYAELTDAALAGQPPKKEEYKIMRSALLLLEPHTMVLATMLFDDARGPEPAEMMAMVASIHLDQSPRGETAAEPR
jgi:hypothetical protein